MKVCNLQVAMNDLAASVKQPQGLVVIFLAGGQGQLHVSTQTHCNTEKLWSQLCPAEQVGPTIVPQYFRVFLIII